jgi:hypothetical protein
MKKWKVIFISIAIAMGIGGAYASYKQDGICSYYVQYRYINGAMTQIDGEQGLDWDCIGGVGICTYYQPSPSSGYLPCHVGVFTLLDNELNAKKK